MTNTEDRRLAPDLRPGDVIHLAPHRAAGRPVNSPEHDVIVEDRHYSDESHATVTVEWRDGHCRGCTVYSRCDTVPVKGHVQLGLAA